MLTMDAPITPQTARSHYSESSTSATVMQAWGAGDSTSPFNAPFVAPFEAQVTPAAGQGSQTVMFALPAVLEENGDARLLSMPVRSCPQSCNRLHRGHILLMH
jgi:hypothetical protein